MKIVVSADKPTLGEKIPVRFGRVCYIIMVDLDTNTCQYLENQYRTVRGEVCGQLAQLLAQKGIDLALAHYWAPYDSQIFAEAGIKITSMSLVTINEALDLLKKAPQIPPQKKDMAIAS